MNKVSDISVAIIDGDESICRSTARLLKAAGIGSVAFFSAEKFLEHPDNDKFDCLLLDIQLDGLSGLELHETLVARGNLTPTLFITAHDGSEVRIQAENAGCAGFFRKSDAGINVLTAIRRVVGQSVSNHEKQP